MGEQGAGPGGEREAGRQGEGRGGSGRQGGREAGRQGGRPWISGDICAHGIKNKPVSNSRVKMTLGEAGASVDPHLEANYHALEMRCNYMSSELEEAQVIDSSYDGYACYAHIYTHTCARATDCEVHSVPLACFLIGARDNLSSIFNLARASPQCIAVPGWHLLPPSRDCVCAAC